MTGGLHHRGSEHRTGMDPSPAAYWQPGRQQKWEVGWGEGGACGQGGGGNAQVVKLGLTFWFPKSRH